MWGGHLSHESFLSCSQGSRKEGQSVLLSWPFVFIYLFVYLFLAVLGLCCCAQAFSSCGERGATLRCGARASHYRGFSCCGARALGAWASVVVVCGLSSYGSRALEHRLSSCGAQA